MTIGFLVTGDEITVGDTLNTNSQVMAHALHSDGLSLGLHLSCRDNENELVACLKFLDQHQDILILIGGLGPTSDDLTRFALSSFLKIPLVEFKEALDHIQARLNRAHLTMNEGNRQQALFPAGAILFPNPNGTAMGCFYTQNNKIYILLPGPPRECIPMFLQYALPLLQRTDHHQKILLKWRLFGVAEGDIAEKLDRALKDVACETGYRLEMPYLEFKVRCEKPEVEVVKAKVEPLVSSHIIATPEQKASEGLRELIENLQIPIVIIDQVTGGALQRLLQRPNNFRWLKFNEEESALHFHVSGLDEYWRQLPDTKTTQLTINYHNNVNHGSETHNIPYRNASVVEYAAEWLCFRLLHLINQLH